MQALLENFAWREISQVFGNVDTSGIEVEVFDRFALFPGTEDYAAMLSTVTGTHFTEHGAPMAGSPALPMRGCAARDAGHSKLCYCETVKNITVSVPDDVYRNARVAAAQRDTSLSALVVAYLERLSGRMDEFARLEALQHEMQAEIGQFRAADRLGRDEIHDRAVR